MIQQGQRQSEVRVDHQIRVGGGRRGDRSHVDHGLDVVAGLQPRQNVDRADKGLERRRGQVLPLFTIAQRIAHRDRGLAKAVHFVNDIGTDETRCSGN